METFNFTRYNTTHLQVKAENYSDAVKKIINNQEVKEIDWEAMITDHNDKVVMEAI